MSLQNNKRFRPSFIVGLLTGVFIGVFVMLFMNKEDNRDSQSKLEEIIHPEKTLVKTPEDEPSELVSNNKNIADVMEISQTESPITSDTLYEEDTVSAVITDSAAHFVIADTLIDTLAITANVDTVQTSETIIVKKDKLIRTLTVELKVIAKRVKTAGDSLVSEVSGIVEPSRNLEYVIEFWRSPINYKGYKMANRKVLLFGLDVFDEVSLYELNEQIYMKHLEDYYILDNTFAFRQFNKLTDETILANLSQ